MQLLELIYQNRVLLLEKFLTEFKDNILAEPCFGVEIEFYLLNQDLSIIEDQARIEDYLSRLAKILSDFSLFKEVQKEQGRGQIEIKTEKTHNLIELGRQLEKMKLVAKDFALEQNLAISLASQPFLNDCGSALQLNFSLYNLFDSLKVNYDNYNLYSRSKNHKNQILLYSIAGILKLLNSMMIFCASKPDDYLRFDKKINQDLFQKGKYSAPINISWGINNRTTAIRIPEIISDLKHQQSRLEFRVPTADSDIYVNMLCLLIAVEYGIKNHLNFIELNLSDDGIYGNAFDLQYNLQDLTSNYQAAQNDFSSSENYLKLKLLKLLKMHDSHKLLQ